MARLVQHWGGSVTCIDVWHSEPVFYGGATTANTMARCRQNLEDAGVGSIVSLIQSRTDVAALNWDRGPIDYLYVDADHAYISCKSDLELWWPYLRIGGLIAGDDYGDPRYGVTQAWDEFEREHGQGFEHKVTPGLDPEGTQLVWGVKR